jgi:hypothetical protein
MLNIKYNLNRRIIPTVPAINPFAFRFPHAINPFAFQFPLPFPVPSVSVPVSVPFTVPSVPFTVPFTVPSVPSVPVPSVSVPVSTFSLRPAQNQQPKRRHHTYGSPRQFVVLSSNPLQRHNKTLLKQFMDDVNTRKFHVYDPLTGDSVIDGLNFLRYFQKIGRVGKASNENMGITNENALSCAKFLYDYVKCVQYTIYFVMRPTPGQRVFVAELQKITAVDGPLNNLTIYIGHGPSDNTDDIMCIFLSCKFKMNLVSNDGYTKQDEIDNFPKLVKENKTISGAFKYELTNHVTTITF